MISISATLKGLRELVSGLDEAREEIDAALIVHTRSAMEAFVEDLSDYPPETAANNPPAPFWIRGTGLTTNNQGTNISRQSEKTIASWIIAQDSQEDESVVIGRNTAGNAPWVHGSNYQASFHAARDWQKAKTVSERLGIPVSVIEQPTGYPQAETQHEVPFEQLTPIIRNPIMAIIERLRQKLSG